MAQKGHRSHVPHKQAEWQTHLRAAIEAAYGSINGYAKHLAGDGATTKQVDAKRRPIQKWLEVGEKPAPVPSVQSVTRLLQDGVQVDPAVFPRGVDRPRPYTTAEVGEMVEGAMANQQKALRILERLSGNIASAVAVAETNGGSIEALRIEIESLRGDLERARSNEQRRRRAS
jgi:hypothetical protein